MDVNLPYLGSTTPGANIGTINLSGDVSVLTAVVLTNNHISVVEGDHTAIELFVPSAVFEIPKVELQYGAYIREPGDDVYPNLAPNITLYTNADVINYEINYDLLNFVAVTHRAPYFIGKIVGRHSSVENISVTAETIESGDTSINGTIVEGYAPTALNVNVPVHSISSEYNVNSPVYAFETSISIPIELTSSVESGFTPSFFVAGDVNSVSLTMETEVFTLDSVRYEIADIDHGIASGAIKIFPNQWTLCFANKPVNEDGENETISSFFISKLVEKYGSDIHNQISMIVGKNPDTGEEYNFVVQDGYVTPTGSFNDFDMCYYKDGAYYPVPFMVQSVSDTELEINWAV